jgi:hypothetical protein
MKLNDQPVGVRQRLILYHGTSTARLRSVLAENRLSPTRYLEMRGGDLSISTGKVSLTTEPSVAEKWAHLAAVTDTHDHFSHDSSGVVLKLDGERLVELGYDLKHFSDPIWGEGQCDCENEIACWEEIDPLDEVLITIEPGVLVMVEPIPSEFVKVPKELPLRAPVLLRRCRRRVARRRLGHDLLPLKEVTALRRAIIHAGQLRNSSASLQGNQK